MVDVDPSCRVRPGDWPLSDEVLRIAEPENVAALPFLTERQIGVACPLDGGGCEIRALLYDGTTTELVDAMEVRKPGPRDVIVEIAAAGMCHSDLSFMSGLYPVPSPAVCGHEAAGIVAVVGDAVTHVVPGDHVVIATLAACGMCDRCASGKPTACRKTLGNASQPFSLDGDPIWNFAAVSAFAERTVVRDVQCVKIPKDVPLASAALVGCGVVTGQGRCTTGPTSRRVRPRRCSAPAVSGST